MTPDRSVSTPQVLPRNADRPAATTSAKSAAPGLRMMSGATIAGSNQTAYRRFWIGPIGARAVQIPPAATKTTPKATPMTAATTMSRVRQRRSGAAAVLDVP